MEDSDPFIDPLLGATVGGYTVEERIGEGGMAVVYRALDRQSGWPVALKVFQRAWAQDPKVVRRFVREARIASALKNPNTVAILDFGEAADGVLYIAMELLQGSTLREFVAARRGLPPPLAVEIASQISLSLVDAHEHGVVHRDLKPDNVFVTLAKDGTLLVKVLDYGVARVVAPDSAVPAYTVLTQIGTILGTPAYMAPEQARAEEVDARTDLYSLGVMLFEMLEGRPPFFERNPIRLLEMHKTEPAPEPESAPAPLRSLVGRLLRKSPDERPGSAAEVLGILRELNASASPAERTVREVEVLDDPRPAVAGSGDPDAEPDEVRTNPQIPKRAPAGPPASVPETRALRLGPEGVAAARPLDVGRAVPAMPPPTRPSRTGPAAAIVIVALGIAASVAIAWSQRSALGPRSVPRSTGAPSAPPSSEVRAPAPEPDPEPASEPDPEPAPEPDPATPSDGPWSGSFRTPDGFLRLTQSGDRVTGIFGRPGRMGRLWGRVEGEAIELRWTRRASDGTGEELGRGRMRRRVSPDGTMRLTVSLGSGEAVTGVASWTALPAPD
jgi:serine/threonine-protein kinase